jgi:hypothetical protein
MKASTEADFSLDEHYDRWVAGDTLELFGKPVQLTLSTSAAQTVEQAQLNSLNRLMHEEGHL